jgi:superfamily II RNA helicase
MTTTMLTIRDNKYEGSFSLPDFFHAQFELDPFQKHAVDCINRNEDVLITAHTGSGKTVPAEYAIAKALHNGKQVIYTAPIKTLSNQKYKDFSEKFGVDKVGIITGDIKNNPDAPCLIMTTEILRNILYRQKNGIVTSNPFDININMSEVEAVIFDEVHYVNDRDRGTVWEESIIMLDPKINLVMLSATIDDADQFAIWIGDIKQKKISLISTHKRPVPLQHYIFIDELYKIQDEHNNFIDSNFDEALKQYDKLQKKRFNYKHMLISSVSYLKERQQLPATYFVLNRKNCSVFAKLLPQSLITPEESTEAIKLFEKYLAKFKDRYVKTNQYQEILRLLAKGIAIHHSGIIPVLKEAIEMIYAQGLIKVLFATETFAAGVNMPTKTVIFTQLTKFDGKKRNLKTDEYKQMAGRAGRRGMDTFGTVIQLPLYEFTTKLDTKNIMLGKTSAIRSKFDINYKFILKMLSIYSEKDDLIDNIVEMAKKSYLSKQNNAECGPLLDKIKVVENKLGELGQFTEEELLTLEEYHNIKEILKTGIQFGIRINPKTNKKYAKEIKQIESQKSEVIKRYDPEYLNYLEINDEYKSLALDKDYFEGIFKYQVNMILDFLKDREYINDDFKLTPLGVIAKEINECNEIILSQVVYKGYLNDLSEAEIVGLISIFINDSGNNKDTTIPSLNLPKYLETILYDIGSISEDFAYKENDMIQKNNIYIYNDWELHLGCFNAASEWTKGKEFYEIKQYYDSFEGNLIKNILRISNIIRELTVVAELLKNHDLYKKLLGIGDIILRNEVTVESLYV